METKLQVLALFARGDTYEQVSTATGIKIPALQKIKERNKAALEVIQNRMIDYKVSKSKKILDKTHSLIDKKLDKVAASWRNREELEAKYKSGEIPYEEFIKQSVGFTDVTLTELNSVSREAFNQSQIESGKPTSIANSPHEATQDLMRLVEALKGGDEIVLERLVFNPNSHEANEIIEGETV